MRRVNRKGRALAAGGLALAIALTTAPPTLAHHSFAPYEPELQIALTGTITHYQWTNPHIYLEIDAPDPETGEMRHWLIECANPGILNRIGWSFDMMSVGDTVDVIVAPLRNGEPGALLKAIRLPDGTVHSNGGPAGPATIEFAPRESRPEVQAPEVQDDPSIATLVSVGDDGADGAATRSDVVRGINGTWERYPSLSAGLGSETDASLPAPPDPIPDPPLKPEYLEPWLEERDRIAALTEDGLPPANHYSACIGDGMPAMMQGMFPMETLETPGQVTFIQEAYNQVRRVYLGGDLPEPERAEPRFAGHSSGRWEDDTLVIETVGVKDYVEFRNVPHSNQMRITERIRLLDGGDYMQNEVTVTDPVYLTEPWTWTWMYKRWPNYRIQEYVCEDNKYFEDPELGYARLRID